MKVLIVEDEIIAAKRLQKLIHACDPSIQILDVLQTAIDVINFLSEYKPDLIFLDVQLSDGICFEIFERIEVDSPIIFTTAYNDYTLRAFKVNSIDYLLKPIRKEELNQSIKKFKKYRYHDPNSKEELGLLLREYIKDKNAYKCRFLVKSGRGFVSINVDEIAYILSENKLNYIITNSGKRYVVDHTLEQIESMLDPVEFLKINRNFVVSPRCITRIEPHFNNRMLLELDPPSKQDVYVTRSYLKSFKKWMNK